MRLLVATQNFASDGGAGNHVADSVSALRAAGHDVHVVASNVHPGERHAVEVLAGIDAAKVDAGAAHRLHRLIADYAPHVVHVHDLADLEFVASLQASRPLAWTVHNFLGCSTELKYFRDDRECHRPHGPGCVPRWGLKGCGHRLNGLALPSAYRRTTRTLRALRHTGTAIVLSRFMADHLAMNGVSNVAVAPPFIRPGPRTEIPAERRIVFAGRVTEHKGIHVLIRAMRDVDAILEVCGDGWSLTRAREQAASLKLDHRVCFRGWLDACEVQTALRRSQLCVVPSRWPEPFGLVGLEAMAASRPVVASKTGGIPEWLDNGRTGTLIQPGNAHALASAMSALLDQTDRMSEMGANGRARVVGRFTPEAHVAAMEAAYAGACRRFAL